MTALIWASGRGHTEVVNHLLEAGANPNAADKVRDARECEVDSRVFNTRELVCGISSTELKHLYKTYFNCALKSSISGFNAPNCLIPCLWFW